MEEPEVAKVYLWANGMLMVFDSAGEQIPELQGRDTDHLRSLISERSTPNTQRIGFPPDEPCRWNVI